MLAKTHGFVIVAISIGQVVRLAGFEPATFGSGGRRSNPAELQAHALILFDLAGNANP
jgi:hypothetical protein